MTCMTCQHHDSRHDPASEIVDLVSWVPEVAADTNLSEADWLPLYHASESLMANLRAAKDELRATIDRKSNRCAN